MLQGAWSAQRVVDCTAPGARSALTLADRLRTQYTTSSSVQLTYWESFQAMRLYTL